MSVIESSELISDRSHQGHAFVVQVLGEAFDAREVRFQHRNVTGAQLAEAIGAHPVENFVVLAQLKTFELETLRPTEESDATKALRFFVLEGDSTHRFMIDGLSLEWPRRVVTGRTLRRLIGKEDEDIDLFLEREGAPDKMIDDEDEVRLGAGGVERLHTRKVHVTIIVNTREKEWTKKKISFGELVTLAYPAPPPGQFIVYTVTYFDGPPHRPEGTLTDGQSIKVRDRMVFSVKFTDKS